MSRDQVLGGGLLICSLAIIIVYVWLIFYPPIMGIDIFILKITGALAVSGIFGILAWIGYTLVTTPAPKSIQ
ncbi:MAG: transcriptional regulator [Candidatus Bathyarchaeia archaeon]